MPSNHLILCRTLLLPPSIFPSVRVFSKSQFFESGAQSIGASATASVLPMNIQDWFPLELTGLILQSKGLSRVFSSTTIGKHRFIIITTILFLISLHFSNKSTIQWWMCEFQASMDCLSVHLLLQKYFPGQSAGPGGKQDTEQNFPSWSAPRQTWTEAESAVTHRRMSKPSPGCLLT